MSKPLILNRLEMLEQVANGFPPKPGGTPKPNPMPGGVKGQPPPAQPGAPPAPGQPPPAGPPGAPPPGVGEEMAKSVKATVKMLDDDKPVNPTGKGKQPAIKRAAKPMPFQPNSVAKPKQEAQDDGTDSQPAEDPADAGATAGSAGQQGGAAEGDEGQDQDGGQAAAPAAGEVASDADGSSDAEDPGAEGGDAEAGGAADNGKPALQGPELEAAAKQMMAELMAGFHGLMADNMHDLAGTSDDGQEQADGSEAGDEEGEDAGQQIPPEPADGEEGGAADAEAGGDAKGAEAGGLKKPPVENAHRCPNCGYALDEAEWEDEECPQCGEVVNNEQERAPDGRFGSGDGSLAKGWAAVTRLTGKVDALVSKIPLLGTVKDAGKALMGKIHSGLEARYGPKVAGTVMGSGFFGGYGVAGTAMKLFAFPGLPFVNDLVAIGVLAGACEAGLQAGRAYRKLTGNEDLSEPREWIVDQLAQLVWKLIRQHKAELAQQAKGHEAEITEAAEEWKQ